MRHFLLLSVLVSATTGLTGLTTARAADGEIKGGTYSEPTYSNNSLPAISSCEAAAKNAGEDGFIPGTGNAIVDTVTSTANTLNKGFGKGKLSGKGVDDEDGESGVGLDTDCEKLYGNLPDLSVEDAEKTSCGVFDKGGNYLADQAALVGKIQQKLACEKGVLGAIRGEIACFKKQIGDAEKFVDNLVTGKGGLNDMLKGATETMTKMDQEIQDRTSQLKLVDERINGGPNQLPPGLASAMAGLAKLTTSLPGTVDAAEKLATNVQTVVQQAETAEIYSCLNESQAGKTCVSASTSNSIYPAGSVSLLQQIQCLSSQSINRVTSSGVVGDRTSERNEYEKAKTALTLTGRIRAESAMNDKIETYSEVPEYKFDTPAKLNTELRAQISKLRAKDGTQAKAFLAAFDARYKSCSTAAASKIAQTKIKVEKAVKSKNAAIYRDIRNQYSTALQAATGKSIMLNTAQCESGSLADQTTCFQRMNKMVDCLYTGQSCASGAVSGASIGLTDGMDAVKSFLGSVPAKANPNRTLTVACAGISDCLAKYTSLRTGLDTAVGDAKQAKETMKTNVNSKIQNAAMNLASGKDANTGVDLGLGMTVNKVTTSIDAAKAKIIAAMGRLKLSSSLDLSPKKVPGVEVDEKSGLYKMGDLRNLVLGAINPGLPDSNGDGFKDAGDAIKDKEKDLTEEKKSLAKFISALKSKSFSCLSDAKKAVCEHMKSENLQCLEKAKNDPLNLLVKGANDPLARALSTDASAEKLQKLVGEAIEMKKNGADTSLECGFAPDEMNKYCPHGDMVSDAMEKPATEIMSRLRNAGGQNSAGALETQKRK